MLSNISKIVQKILNFYFRRLFNFCLIASIDSLGSFTISYTSIDSIQSRSFDNNQIHTIRPFYFCSFPLGPEKLSSNCWFSF